MEPIPSVLSSIPASGGPLEFQGTDFIELLVGNGRQAAHYYQTAFGFQPLAYAGPETGNRELASYVLRQDKITLVLSTPLLPEGEPAAHIFNHGDGVRTLALEVEDARAAWEEALSRGAESYQEPRSRSDADGEAVLSAIHTYGDTLHVFVERKNYRGTFLPGYRAWTPEYRPSPAGLSYVDHCVGNVGWNQMNRWVDYYEKVLGFRNILSFDDRDISTEYSALMSKVMSNGNGYIKFPINEPAEGKKRSQVEEYLQYYGGPGVQHIALATRDIIHSVRELSRRGVEFLKVPETYYRDLQARVGPIDEQMESLKELGILVDRDEEGYLLQIFSRPVEDRPTLFFEIIQRKGARSFGKGNFKALFEALEREQALRGNL